MMRCLALLVVLSLATSSCGPRPAPTATTAAVLTSEAGLALSTTAFEPGGAMPVRYSCFGDNVSPALEWSGVPPAAQSLLLLVHDLDAGANRGASTPLGFAHWIVYDIPLTTTGYAEGVGPGETLPDGARQGSNDFAPFREAGEAFPGGAAVKLVGYDGPCPPGGEHRYQFHLYALDARLDLPAAATLAHVLEAMEGHVLAEAAVIGLFAPP
jgi:Raf kinase inhibitor-like YbhB/YbcL family protein